MFILLLIFFIYENNAIESEAGQIGINNKIESIHPENDLRKPENVRKIEALERQIQNLEKKTALDQTEIMTLKKRIDEYEYLFEDPTLDGYIKESQAVREDNNMVDPKVGMKYLDSILERQSVDARWTQDMNTAFESHFHEIDTVEIIQSKCGDLFCKFEMNFPDNEGDIQFALEKVHTLKALEGMVMLQVDDSINPPIMTLYVSKKGTVLPFFGSRPVRENRHGS